MEKNLIQKNTANMAKKDLTLADWVRRMEKGIEKALPSVLTPERFTRIVLSAISNNPLLAQCEPKSFLGAMMTTAQLGLEPNTPLGQAWLVPFKNNKKGIYECVFEIGYKGLIDLAYRSGEVKIIQAHVVHENDEFEFEYGLNPKLMHRPARGDRGDATYVYAAFQTINGGAGFGVMTTDDVYNFAKTLPSYKAGPWQTDFEEMAKKTVLKRVLKYAPLKSDYVKAATNSDEMLIKAPEQGTETIPVEEYDVSSINNIPEDVVPETGEVKE